jgi:hypothetical protein
MRKFNRKNCRLDFIEAKIASDDTVEIARIHPVIAKNTQFLRQLSVPANDHSRIASGSKVF